MHQLTSIYSHTKRLPASLRYSKVDAKTIGVNMPKKIFSNKSGAKSVHGYLFFIEGVSHAEELQFLFPIAESLFISALPTKEDEEIRKGITQLWVDFARTG